MGESSRRRAAAPATGAPPATAGPRGPDSKAAADGLGKGPGKGIAGVEGVLRAAMDNVPSNSRQILAEATEELVAFAKAEAEAAATRTAARMVQEASEQQKQRFNASDRDVAELERIAKSEADTANALEQDKQVNSTLARASAEIPILDVANLRDRKGKLNLYRIQCTEITSQRRPLRPHLVATGRQLSRRWHWASGRSTQPQVHNATQRRHGDPPPQVNRFGATAP